MDKARVRDFLNRDIGNKKIDIRILSLFLKQLSLLLKSGLSLDQALSTIEDQEIDKKLTKTLGKINKNLSQGYGAYQAFKEEEEAFNPLIIAFIKSGDESGKLGEIMEDLSSFLTEENKNKNMIRAALTYPIILLVVTILVVIIIFNFVFPQFIASFEDSGLSLPRITRAMISLTNFFSNYGLTLAITILSLVLIHKLLRLNKTYRRKSDETSFNRPFFKSFRRLKLEYDISSLLYILKRGDIEIIESMEIIKNAFKNTYIRDILGEVAEDLKKGTGLSESFAKAGIFSKLFISMLEIGEDSANMTESLGKSADYYSNEYIFRLNKISRMAEPILIIIMSLVVASVVFSVALPMLDSLDLYY